MKGLARDEGVGSTMRTIHRYDSHCLRGDDQWTASSFAFVSNAKVGSAIFSLFSLCRIYYELKILKWERAEFFLVLLLALSLFR